MQPDLLLPSSTSYFCLTELQDTVGESAGWGLGELTLGAGLLKEARGTNLDL